MPCALQNLAGLRQFMESPTPFLPCIGTTKQIVLLLVLVLVLETKPSARGRGRERRRGRTVGSWKAEMPNVSRSVTLSDNAGFYTSEGQRKAADA